MATPRFPPCCVEGLWPDFESPYSMLGRVASDPCDSVCRAAPAVAERTRVRFFLHAAAPALPMQMTIREGMRRFSYSCSIYDGFRRRTCAIVCVKTLVTLVPGRSFLHKRPHERALPKVHGSDLTASWGPTCEAKSFPCARPSRSLCEAKSHRLCSSPCKKLTWPNKGHSILIWQGIRQTPKGFRLPGVSRCLGMEASWLAPLSLSALHLCFALQMGKQCQTCCRTPRRLFMAGIFDMEPRASSRWNQDERGSTAPLANDRDVTEVGVSRLRLDPTLHCLRWPDESALLPSISTGACASVPC
jgi:hypothetical protein